MPSLGDNQGISNGLDRIKDNGIPYRYPCDTQSPSETKTHKSDPTEINLGWKHVVPRWKPGSILKWKVDSSNFDNPEDASYATDQLVKAVAVWNDMNLGVSFLQVESSTPAVFTLKYNGENGQTLADSFFPNGKLSNDLNVYSRAFKDDAKHYLDKVFQHELGHTLGLRHEFAAEEGDFVLFGAANAASVMAYNWPPEITAQDIKETQMFYAWAEPEISSDVNSYKIADQVPRGGK